MVRNYDSPDPKRVVANLKAVLESRDMARLSRGAYQFVILHCGFIAHYDQNGFIATYRHDVSTFVEQFLKPHLGDTWGTWLDNPHSYLYDVSYNNVMLADIIRQLIPIFERHQQAIKREEEATLHAGQVRRLHALAEALGYEVRKKEAA